MQFANILALVALSAVAEATPFDLNGRDTTPTTPSDSASCVTALASPTPSSFICGLNGSLKSPARIARFPSGGSSDGCRTTCLGNKACVSYSYNSQTGYCQTFSKALIKMGWTVNAKSAKQFYNRNCFSYTPSGCNLVSTPTSSSTTSSTPASSSTPKPSATPLTPIGNWVQAQAPGNWYNGYYLSGAWADQNYNSLILGANSRYATSGSLFDTTNGFAYTGTADSGLSFPLWQQPSPCSAATSAYFYSTPRQSGDVNPSCVSDLATPGTLRSALVCSTGNCGVETWSFPNYQVLIGPASSPSPITVAISYAYPQIASSFEGFLLKIASSDQTIDGLFIAIDAAGTGMTLVEDYGDAFSFYLYYGFLQSQDQTIFVTGTFSDSVGMMGFGTDPYGGFDTTEDLVACNPVGSPPIMECSAMAQSNYDTFNRDFYPYNSQLYYCVNDATYGTGLAFGSSSGCSAVTVQVWQAPAAPVTTT